MAAYEVLLLNTAVPQIQAAQAGDTYVCPRDIQITANLDVTGNTILGDASTDTVRVNGYMGVGGAGSSAIAIRATNTALSGLTQYGFASDITASSSATTAVYGYYTRINTAAAAFTTSLTAGLFVKNTVLGAGSAITDQHGIYIENQSNGTNNYGITSLVSSGTNKWNIYASGTADNYFAGNVGVGTSTPDYKLQISGTTGQTFSIERVASSIGSSTALGTIAGTGEIPTLTADGASIQFLGAGTWSSTSSPGRIVFNTTPAATTTPVERFQLAAGEAVFNDPGNDYDFRVESDTNTHALFVQGSDGFVGIGTSSPSAKLQVDTGLSNSTPAIFSGSGRALYVKTFSSPTNGVSLGYGDASHLNIDSSGNLISTAPTTPPTLSTNGTMVFNLTSNTNLRISVRGSDGVTRTADITLA